MSRFQFWLRFTLTEFKVAAREWQTLVLVFLYPLVILFVFGGIFGNESIPGMPSGYLDEAIAGYICLVVAVAGGLNFPLKLIHYEDKDVFRTYAFTPISRAGIQMSLAVVYAVYGLFSIILMVLAGFLFYGLWLPNLLVVILGLIVIHFSIYGFSLLIKALFKNPRTAQLLIFILFFLMLFLSGTAIPRGVMPIGIQSISKFFPLTYAVDFLGTVWDSGVGAFMSWDFGIILGIGLGSLGFYFLISKLRKVS